MLPPRADSDSDSGSDDLGEGGLYYAERLKLRLRLRKWESDFVGRHGRAAVYEDKKLDKAYQQLRSQLRQTELAWRHRESDEVYFGRAADGSTSRSGHSSRAGLSSRRSQQSRT